MITFPRLRLAQRPTWSLLRVHKMYPGTTRPVSVRNLIRSTFRYPTSLEKARRVAPPEAQFHHAPSHPSIYSSASRELPPSSPQTWPRKLRAPNGSQLRPLPSPQFHKNAPSRKATAPPSRHLSTQKGSPRNPTFRTTRRSRTAPSLLEPRRRHSKSVRQRVAPTAPARHRSPRASKSQSRPSPAPCDTSLRHQSPPTLSLHGDQY